MNADLQFQSFSQAGQDRFVWEVLGPRDHGTFLDIGANHPVEKNNTWALERMGWTGICVEADPACAKLLREQRKATVIEDDATRLDYGDILMRVARMGHMDYLSLDVDEASLDALKKVMESGVRFNVLTVEHDAYRFGDKRRGEMVGMLIHHGYFVLCDEVCDQGLPFEIWAVDVHLEGMCDKRWWRADPTDWKEFFDRA